MPKQDKKISKSMIEEMISEHRILMHFKEIALNFVGRVQPNQFISGPEIQEIEAKLALLSVKHSKILQDRSKRLSKTIETMKGYIPEKVSEKEAKNGG